MAPLTTTPSTRKGSAWTQMATKIVAQLWRASASRPSATRGRSQCGADHEPDEHWQGTRPAGTGRQTSCRRPAWRACRDRRRDRRSIGGRRSLESLAASARLIVVPVRMHVQEIEVDEALVRRLLGADASARASAARRRRALGHRQRHLAARGRPRRAPPPHRLGDGTGRAGSEWLPRLAPHLPVAVPEPVAMGEPADGYPYRWAVHRWIPGEGAALDRIDDPVTFALDLAERRPGAPATCRPTAPRRPATGRGRCSDYDESTRRAIDRASHLIDVAAATAVWEEALAAPPHEARPSGSTATSRGTAWSGTAACAASSTGVRPAPATPPSTSRSSGRRSSPTSPERPSSSPGRRRRHARPQPGGGDQPGLRRVCRTTCTPIR